MQLRAAKIAELLAAYRNVGVADVASAAPSSTATSQTAGGKPKVKLGKNIIEDYKTVSIGQSAYFTGAAHSTLSRLYQGCYMGTAAQDAVSCSIFLCCC